MIVFVQIFFFYSRVCQEAEKHRQNTAKKRHFWLNRMRKSERSKNISFICCGDPFVAAIHLLIDEDTGDLLRQFVVNHIIVFIIV